MKQHIKSYDTSRCPLKFNVVFNIMIPEYTDGLVDAKIAAASYSEFDIPEGPLIPTDKDALIDTQPLDDYHSFVESVEDLLTQYYNLELYYKNNSEYNLFYFGILAKDSDGNLIADLVFTLRISIYSAKSQSDKKQQKAKLSEVLKCKPKGYFRISVTVNDKAFDNWMDAYLEIDADLTERINMRD